MLCEFNKLVIVSFLLYSIIAAFRRSQFCLDHLSWRTFALGSPTPLMLRSSMRQSKPMLTASLQVSQMAITPRLVRALI